MIKVPGRTAFIWGCSLLGALMCSTILVDGLDHLSGFLQVQNRVKAVKESDPSDGSDAAPIIVHQPKTPGKLKPGIPIDTGLTPDLPKIDHYQPNLPTRIALAVLGLIVGAGVGAGLVRFRDWASFSWQKMATGDKLTLFLGVFAGIIATLPFLFLFQSLGELAGGVITVALMTGFSALSVYALKSMEEALPWHKLAGSRRKTGVKVLDTNVLIDGRVYDLIRSGFLDGEIYVPSFVLLELQHIADSPDSLRRQRGRRGLEVLRRIQAEFPVEVGTHDRYAGDAKDEVDSRLVTLAKSLGGDLVSNDFNLNRVATIQSVRVLNINDLALALRPTVLPGEPLEVMVIKEGNQYQQGVGYLDDGTMVVIEGGAKHIGETIPAEVTQVIQTERGKMIFADAPGEGQEGDDGNGRRRPRR